MIKNSLFRNKEYDGVRLTIVGSQSGVQNIYYTEASGSRYYYQIIGTTTSPDMESATFDSFISITQSGVATASFDIIPMLTGETVMLETRAVAINANGSKGYVCRSFGGWRHSGSSLSVIGSGVDYLVRTDFSSGLGITFSSVGTQSVRMTLTCPSGENVDWDIHLRWTKGFHSISSGGGNPSKLIYQK